MEISPYLSAIQALRGQTPGEKYKNLHSIAIQIIQNEHEKKAFLESGFTSHVQPALLPFLRIIVGNKLKIQEFVVEALKSDDVAIVEQALGAKWFFNGKNEYIRVDYFLNKIMPFVSLRTRRRLIKTLAKCLRYNSPKAEEFFTSFDDLYGLDQTLPIIVACSKEFILNTVFMRRIELPNKILRTLHLENSTFVVRYLQLGNEENESNQEDRNIHKIDITKYLELLPIILMDHIDDFIWICESIHDWHNREIKIGSTRAKFFLSCLNEYSETMAHMAKLAFKIIPLKIISSQLLVYQFETVFGYLFPKNELDLSIYDMIEYLRYYPAEKKFSLLREKYKLAYGNDILDKPDIYRVTQFFRILPFDVKENFGRKVLELHQGTSEYYDFVMYLPPREVIPMMKERITRTGSAHKVSCIRTMINSCSYYNSKEDLLEVLQYYNDQYKNEPAEVSLQVLDTLLQQFVFGELDKPCWRIMLDLARKLYIKGQFYLYDSTEFFFRKLFHNGLLFFANECQKDPSDDEMKQSLDKLIEIYSMILDCYLEHNMKVDPLPTHYCSADLKRDCLKKYLVTIPLLYPENHEVWAKFGNKLTLVSYLVQSIDDYDFNELCRRSLKKYKSGDTVGGKTMLRVRDYPWLTKFTLDLLKSAESYTDSEDIRKYDDLKKSLKRHDRQLYESFVDGEIDCMRNSEVGVALSFLKHEPTKILNKWKSYLNVCRENLKSSRPSLRKFVKAMKWHKDLPIKFVEQSLLEIKDDGSITVLALLLDGETLGKIIQLYMPKDKEIDETNDDAKSQHRFVSSLIKSMNHVNPPVNLEIISAFCQGDYVHLACNTLRNVALRIPIDKVITFANQLINNNSVPIRKLKIELACRVSSYVNSGVLALETNAWIRAKIAKVIWKQFKQTSNLKTSQLMKSCIDGLTADDMGIFRMLSKVDDVDKDFVCQYLRDLLKKIDELEDPERSNLVYSLMENLIDTTIVNFISDDVLVDILKKQFFKCSPRFIYTAYLFNDPNKFDERLKTFLDIVNEKFKEYNKPHPLRLRYYPMNVQLHQFFDLITTYVLSNNNTDMSKKLITACLDLLSEKLQLYEEPRIFMTMYIVNDYMESPTPQEFGIKCMNTVRRLVESLGSEMILSDIEESVVRMLCYEYVYPDNGITSKMDVIEGLSQVDERLAALIGIKMLSTYDIGKYHDRYDEFFKRWNSMKDPMVLAALNIFRNLACDYKN